ncbi:universal stress protein family protein [Parvularcula bermudensis HTCC2503]|uniref:Universal stress protein family protein n=1 Tax=Parvularcula bermudensis (strain ATCC BAA-594 / HTCC2503 / KCTC 12087) TaxID=314260 RepID=E0TFD8_PARBH|nr:universal stress protein [Parvularcula bermudensis]ADM09539.1 universal stress protein family protein [Parvularcula bermudensis HTCC2503]
MAIGTVIVPAFDPKGVQQAVSAALPFVESQGAHLVGLHLRERYPASQVPEYNWHAAVLKEFEAGVAARADEIRHAFEVAKGSADATWLQPEGSEGLDFGPALRAADLIVVPSPKCCDRPDAAGLIEDILIGSGRPVLLAPGTVPPAVPKSYLIGWNGSLEAASAVAVARPLLDLAERVSVVSVGRVTGLVPTAEAVADTLRRGGIAAEVTMLDKKGSVMETLRSEAAAADIDTLLVGAYSHSRIRERVLGGVTRHTVTDPFMRTLLVH